MLLLLVNFSIFCGARRYFRTVFLFCLLLLLVNTVGTVCAVGKWSGLRYTFFRTRTDIDSTWSTAVCHGSCCLHALLTSTFFSNAECCHTILFLQALATHRPCAHWKVFVCLCRYNAPAECTTLWTCNEWLPLLVQSATLRQIMLSELVFSLCWKLHCFLMLLVGVVAFNQVVFKHLREQVLLLLLVVTPLCTWIRLNHHIYASIFSNNNESQRNWNDFRKVHIIPLHWCHQQLIQNITMNFDNNQCHRSK